MPFQMRGITVKCPTNSTNYCTHRCQQCRIPICSLSFSSSKHKRHQKMDILKNLPNIKELIKHNWEELQKKHLSYITRECIKHPGSESWCKKSLSETDNSSCQTRWSPSFRNRQHYPGNEVRNWWHGRPTHSSYR